MDYFHRPWPRSLAIAWRSVVILSLLCSIPVLSASVPGQICSTSTDCESLICVGSKAGGVCCTEQCDLPCYDCVSVRGSCTQTPSGTDPFDACPNGVCSSGRCIDDLGTACDPASAGVSCLSNYCVDNVCCQSECKGICRYCQPFTGQCLLAPPGSDPRSDCGGRGCDCNGNCLKALGDPCNEGGECAGGLCRDRFCCNAACEGLCETCAKPGSVGICSYTERSTNEFQECGPNAVCSGNNNACVSNDGVSCSVNSNCLSGFCSIDQKCCQTDCSQPCSTCTDGVCKTKCAPGEICGPSNLCLKPVQASCDLSSECESGICTDNICCPSTCGACDSCQGGVCYRNDTKCPPNDPSPVDPPPPPPPQPPPQPPPPAQSPSDVIVNSPIVSAVIGACCGIYGSRCGLEGCQDSESETNCLAQGGLLVTGASCNFCPPCPPAPVAPSPEAVFEPPAVVFAPSPIIEIPSPPIEPPPAIIDPPSVAELPSPIIDSPTDPVPPPANPNPNPIPPSSEPPAEIPSPSEVQLPPAPEVFSPSPTTEPPPVVVIVRSPPTLTPPRQQSPSPTSLPTICPNNNCSFTNQTFTFDQNGILNGLNISIGIVLVAPSSLLIINGNIFITRNGSLTILSGALITVNGDLVIDNSEVTFVVDSDPIKIRGCLNQTNSILKINITSNNLNISDLKSKNVTVFTNLDPTCSQVFVSVETVGLDETCVDPIQKLEGSTLTVLFDTSRCGDNIANDPSAPDNTILIIAIVIPIAVVIIAVVLVIFLVKTIRVRILPHRDRIYFDPRETVQLNKF